MLTASYLLSCLTIWVVICWTSFHGITVCSPSYSGVGSTFPNARTTPTCPASIDTNVQNANTTKQITGTPYSNARDEVLASFRTRASATDKASFAKYFPANTPAAASTTSTISLLIETSLLEYELKVPVPENHRRRMRSMASSSPLRSRRPVGTDQTRTNGVPGGMSFFSARIDVRPGSGPYDRRPPNSSA